MGTACFDKIASEKKNITKDKNPFLIEGIFFKTE